MTAMSAIAAALCAGMALEAGEGLHRTRADCVSATHAIEIDWSRDWAEGVGQALMAAQLRGLAPGLALVCAKRLSRRACERHAANARAVFWTRRLRATLWLCEPGAASLAACRREEIRR